MPRRLGPEHAGGGNPPSPVPPRREEASLRVQQVTLPVPFPLRTANVYLVATPEGTVLIDTAFYTPAAWGGLVRAVTAFTETWGPLCAIVLTHHHPDHIGMAGRLQQRYGVPVLASPGEAALIPQVWGPGADGGGTAFYRDHGMPAAVLDDITKEIDDLLAVLAPLPRVDGVIPRRPLVLGGLAFTPVVTPGHSPAHLCLYHAPSGVLLVGDQLLPRITPNIGWYPYTSPDPLRDFLRSLGVIEQLPVRQALPGHGPAMWNTGARIAELRAHHAARLTATRALLDGNTLTGHQVALGLFGTDLSSQEVRLAMVEAIAHLEHLRHQGEVVLDRRGPQAVYRRR